MTGVRIGAVLGGVAAAVLAFPAAGVQAVPGPHRLAPAAQASSARLRVGSATLAPCSLGTSRAAWCGYIDVPLDYTDAGAGTIQVGFGWVPAQAGAGAHPGTVVAQEGGPGYPSTGAAPDYVTLLGGSRNLLVVDARGTGRSTPVDCRRLQTSPAPAPTRRFTAAVTACGRQLDHTWRRAGGGWVHASDLFTTANAARDLARVLRTLRLDRVDLYGDSYGTYFAQSFLARYPRLLHAVVLDSAYEVKGLDPWYRTTVTTARAAFDAVCTASRGCPRGSSWQRIGRLAALLRRHPVVGRAPGTDGRLHRVTVDVPALVNLVNDAGYDPGPYLQLDAAARALLHRRDAVPLLRLYAESVGYDYGDYRGPARRYSDGLYMAVACTDYPQLFDMRASVARRQRELRTAVAKLPPRTFAPFTTAEWLHVLPYTETYSGCLTWPAPSHAPDPPVPAWSRAARHVPVLVLNGALDSLTPPAGGARIARQLGRWARALVAANTVHLVALYSAHPCGPAVVRAFLTAPGRAPDSRCLSRLPALRLVPAFPARLAGVGPAAGHAPLRIRRLAAVALAAAGDVVRRIPYLDGDSDSGLRGGAVGYGSGPARLHAVRWTSDTTVSGSLVPSEDGSDGAAGTLLVTGPGGRAERFSVSWGAGRLALLRWRGVALTAPAP